MRTRQEVDLLREGFVLGYRTDATGTTNQMLREEDAKRLAAAAFPYPRELRKEVLKYATVRYSPEVERYEYLTSNGWLPVSGSYRFMLDDIDKLNILKQNPYTDKEC